MCEIKSQPCGSMCTIPEANGEVSVCNKQQASCMCVGVGVGALVVVADTGCCRDCGVVRVSELFKIYTFN